MPIIEIRVPPIGDFTNVPIVALFMRPGETIAVEQCLLTVESEKASMDIPSPVAGRIVEVNVAIGDRIGEGMLLATAAVKVASEPPAAPLSSQSAAPLPPLPDDAAELVVIGGGPGGYSAAFRAADLGLKTVLVERFGTLGGVCLNVGCIPSKALLHIAAVKEEAQRLAICGIGYSEPKLDLAKIREFKVGTVRRLTDGLAQLARMREVEVVTGEAKFGGPNELLIKSADGDVRKLPFRQCIIAAGSSPIELPMLPADPQIVNSTGALELRSIPKRMLVIGGGIIGLEMATVYSALGAQVDIVERLDGLLAGIDRDLVAIWMKRNAHRFDRIMVNTIVASAEAHKEGIRVTLSGESPGERNYDLVLEAAGRVPNGDKLGLDKAGLSTDRGFIAVDQQMRTAVPHIYAVGDLVGQPMLAHKAVHQGHVAAEAAAGHKAALETIVIPSVAYTDPEIAWVGMTEVQAKEKGVPITVAKFPWAASGRAIANGADYGMTKLIFSKATGRIIGGAIVGPNAGDMIGEVCLAIEMGADAVDIGRTIHPHPTLGETIGMAAEVASRGCTDLPPQRTRNLQQL